MSIIENYLLFNHTYLKQLQQDSSYDEAASAAAQGVRDWYEFRNSDSIETLVESWVEPMLSILELDLQPLDDDDPRTYLVYSTYDRSQPVALCYVTPPGADLNTTTKGRHWMAQAVITARKWQAEQGGNPLLRWVILTNGEQWRLLDAHALRRYEAYLQVNLDELALQGAELSAIRIFYHCFHRHAFVPEENGTMGLERMLEASNLATERAEKHLKKRVSDNEGVMGQLCMGLVQATGQSNFTEEERDAIYRDATYLLYQMLFIFYAEARGLLPTTNAAYQQVALGRLVDQAQRYLDEGISDPQATTLWDGLQRLRQAINQGDEELGVPAYNGGLFSDEDKPYLSNFQVSDAYLARSLVDLAYLRNGNGERERIDYRDLSVRHLGSLYEGMIEYKLFIAEEPMLARRDKKNNVRYLSQGEAGGLRRTDQEIDAGQVYFAQSSGERRATGTYYTPEYIVDYIVENTVWKGLEERRSEVLQEKLASWLDELDVARSDEIEKLQQFVDFELDQFIEEQVLTFRVCDPAMGSGHFLVNAAHQMTAFIVETLHLTRWDDAQLNTDPVLWRRRVAESCLCGVDINLMAVELAKLSLWLVSMAEGKPLNFLKHHLHCGNSLIGARLDNLVELLGEGRKGRVSAKEKKAREAGQRSLFELPGFEEHTVHAAGLLQQIARTATETLADVKEQDASYEQVREELRPYRQLADVMVARHFGLDVSAATLRELVNYVNNGGVASVPEYEMLIQATKGARDDYNFFHWELEFPEVFFDEDSEKGESNGFDAVVGNPPYLNMEDMETGARGFYYASLDQKPIFESANDKSNLYAIFWEHSIKLLSTAGRISLITPYSWLSISSYRNLRSFFLEELSICRIELLPNGVFDAGIGTGIMVAVKLREKSDTDTIDVRDLREAVGAKAIDSLIRDSPFVSLSLDSFRRTEDLVFDLEWSPIKDTLFDKLFKQSFRLGEYYSVDLGVKSSNDSRYVGVGYKPEQNPKRILRGQDFERYGHRWNGWYVYYLPSQMLAERTTARPGTVARFERDEKLIVYRFLNRDNHLIAIYDDEGYYALGSTYIIAEYRRVSINLKYVLTLINSQLIAFFNAAMFSGVKITRTEMLRIPIRRIDFTTPVTERARLLEEGKKIYKLRREKDDLAHIMRFTLGELELGRSDVVHDFLVYLAEQMINLKEQRQALQDRYNLFQYLPRDVTCLKFTRVLPAVNNPVEIFEAIDTVHHDIEALRLTQDRNNSWLLELSVQERDPSTNWKDHQRDAEGDFIRRRLPAYHLRLDDKVGRFYHYVFQNLDGFEGAGKFPGGYTRTTEQKLMATKIPEYIDVDLTALEEAEAELAEVNRRIELTDELIDQIVYKLYGLTDEEIAIVEGR